MNLILAGLETEKEGLNINKKEEALHEINNQTNLNRYTGTDKLDNSKRISYGFEITKDKIHLNYSQNYEFLQNSNYHALTGNDYYLSDALGNIKYSGEKNNLNYDVRYDPHLKGFPTQTLTYENANKIGAINITYIDTKKEVDKLLKDESEVLNYGYGSKIFQKYK